MLAGMTLADFPALHAQLTDSPHHFGGQVAILRGGEPVLDVAFGVADPETSEPVRRDHVFCWRSAGKPWTAAALLQLRDEGRLDLDDDLREHLPEFRPAGVSVRHLLTHDSGLRMPVVGWPTSPHQAILDRLMKVDFREGGSPGGFAAYDPVGGWYLLGELVARLDGRPVEEAVAERVFRPAGVGAVLADDYDALAPRLAPQFGTERGAVKPLRLHERPAVERASPGGSARGTALDLARLYDALPRLLPAATLAEMTARQRAGRRDATFGATVDFGLGVIVNSARHGEPHVPYGFGPDASDAAFGHGGAQCAMGFRDPEHELCVAWTLNGLPGEPRHNKRNRDVNAAVYEDLGLASSASP